MTVVDVHTHAYTKEWFDEQYQKQIDYVNENWHKQFPNA